MIKLYSTHCPKCNVIQSILDNKRIEYKLIDDSNIVLGVADKHNIITIPFAEIAGEIYNTKQLQEWIQQQEEQQ